MITGRHHRQWIVDKSVVISEEMSFLTSAIESDNKNYHAWSYRYVESFLIEGLTLVDNG